MWRKLLFVPFLTLCLMAQVQVPHLGSVRCADGSVRPVLGVPAAFVLGKPLLSHAVSASFSEGAGIVGTGSEVLLFDSSGRRIAEASAPDPGVLVNIDLDANSAIAWLPGSSTLLVWDGTAFQEIALPPPSVGKVTSIRREGSTAILLVSDQDGAISQVDVSIGSGSIESVSLLSGVSGSAFSLGSSTLFAEDAGRIEIQTPQGTRALNVPGATGFGLERMTDTWVHITASNTNRSWALHLSKTGSAELYELPGVPVPEVVGR